MDCLEMIFTGHAMQRLFERQISIADVKAIIETGEIIADYPHDCPHPSCLMLGFRNNKPIHIVVAKDRLSGQCFIITLYSPDDALWQPDYRKRR